MTESKWKEKTHCRPLDPLQKGQVQDHQIDYSVNGISMEYESLGLSSIFLWEVGALTEEYLGEEAGVLL